MRQLIKVLLFLLISFSVSGQFTFDNSNCCEPTTAVDSTQLIVGFASGFQDVSTTIQSRNCTITRTSLGLYTITFDSPHPDGTAYEVLFGPEEDGERDIPKPAVVKGSRLATGFRMTLTIDDNGSAADELNDEPFSFEVLQSVWVITGVTVD